MRNQSTFQSDTWDSAYSWSTEFKLSQFKIWPLCLFHKRMTRIFICLGIFPSFALCPVKNNFFRFFWRIYLHQIKIENRVLVYGGRSKKKSKGSWRAVEVWNWQQQADRDKNHKKCLDLPPNLSVNSFHLVSVKVNLLPHLSISACDVKRLVGVCIVVGRDEGHFSAKGL